MLISHSAFIPLKNIYVNAISKGLHEINGDKQSFTEHEKYCFDVMSRVVEIDAVLDNLKIGMHYIDKVDLELPQFEFSKVLVYHIENIVSRLTTVEERIKPLVSTSLLENNIKVASIKGKNKFNTLINDFPPIRSKVALLSGMVSKYKIIRNKIAHESSYSSIDIITASILEKTDMELPIDHPEIKSHILSSIRPEFSSLIMEIEEIVNSVISELGDIYHDLIKET